MAGLDNIKGYEEGKTVTSDTSTTVGSDTVPVGKAVTTKNSPYSLPTSTSPVGVDEGILRRMEQMIAEREKQKGSFLESMKDANAWWSGGMAGPGEALRARAAERSADEATTFGMRRDIAQYQSQQALAKTAQADVYRALGLGPNGTAVQGGGVNADPLVARIDPLIAAQIADLAKTDPVKAKQELLKHTAEMAKIASTARLNKDTYAKVIEVKTPKGLDYISLAEYLANPGAYAATEKGKATADKIASSGDDATRAAIRESGGNPDIGYHDLSKSTAYGTYGITKGAYADIQKANPKFQGRPITSLNADEQKEAFDTYRGLSTDQLNKLGIPLTKQNLDLAHFLGPTGAATYLKSGVISDEAAANHGGPEKAKQIADSILGGKAVAVSAPAATTPVAPAAPAPQVPVAQSLSPNESIVSPKAAPAAPVVPGPVSTPVAKASLLSSFDDKLKALSAKPVAPTAPVVTAPAAPAATPVTPATTTAPAAPAAPAAMTPTTPTVIQGSAAPTEDISNLTIPQLRARAEAEKEGEVARTKEQNILSEKQRPVFEARIDPIQLADDSAAFDRIKRLVVTDPTIAGVLAKQGYKNAVGTFLKEGITTPKGTLNFKGLEDAIFQSLKGTTGLSITRRQELASYLARMELNAAALIAGQGAISEGERTTLRSVSLGLSNTPEMIFKRAEMMERRNQLDKQIAAIYGDGTNVKNMSAFKLQIKDTPEFKQYEKDIKAIANKDYDFKKPGGKPTLPHTPEIQAILDKQKAAQ